jgi:hypothetical protein
MLGRLIASHVRYDRLEAEERRFSILLDNDEIKYTASWSQLLFEVIELRLDDAVFARVEPTPRAPRQTCWVYEGRSSAAARRTSWCHWTRQHSPSTNSNVQQHANETPQMPEHKQPIRFLNSNRSQYRPNVHLQMSAVKSARRPGFSARPPRAQTSVAARSPPPDNFTPREREQLTATSRINAELSTHPTVSQRESKVPFHSIPSRLSKYDLQNRLDHPFRLPDPVKDSDAPTHDDQLYLTFDLLKTMTPRNSLKLLSSTPIFIRTMFLEGTLNPDLVSSVALSLTQNELQKFMLNMTQEINLYSGLNAAQGIADFKEQLMSLVPIHRATIWFRPESSSVLLSPTMKESLTLGQTLLTVGFEKNEDVAMGDPGNFKGFSVDFDLPLLRGCKSMMILPILNQFQEIVPVLRCCGFQNARAEVQSEFTQYYIDVLKIVRDMAQKKFFSSPIPRTIPSNVSNIFAEIDNCSVPKTSQQICRFLQNTFPCEVAEGFEFDDRYRSMVRLTDGRRQVRRGRRRHCVPGGPHDTADHCREQPGAPAFRPRDRRAACKSFDSEPVVSPGP